MQIMSLKDIHTGFPILYKGERWTVRGITPDKQVSIQREDNPNSWRVVSQFDISPV